MATNDLSIRVINTYFSSSEFLIYLTGPETSVWLSHGPIKLTGFKTELLSLPPLNRSSPRSPSEGRWMARNVFSFLIIFFIHLPHHYSLNTSELHLDFIPMSWSFILNGSLKKKNLPFYPSSCHASSLWLQAGLPTLQSVFLIGSRMIFLQYDWIISFPCLKLFNWSSWPLCENPVFLGWPTRPWFPQLSSLLSYYSPGSFLQSNGAACSSENTTCFIHLLDFVWTYHILL